MLKISVSSKHKKFTSIYKGLNFIQDITLPKKKINVMALYYIYINICTNISYVIKAAWKVHDDWLPYLI